jgi:hypothetical protein
VTLHDSIDAAAVPLRAATGWRRFLPAALIGTAILTVAAWFAGIGLGLAAAAVLFGWLSLLVAVSIGLWRARRSMRALGTPAVATRLETLSAGRRGALTTLLAPLAPGTSTSLHLAASEAQAAWVAANGSTVLAFDVQRERRRAGRLGLALAGAVTLLLLARPLGGAPAMLWQPWHAWLALVEPVRLSTDQEMVDRGTSARLDIVALGQQRATLQLRAPGEQWRDTTLALDGAGQATFDTGPLETEIVARVLAGGRSSRELHVQVRLPAFLGAFTITAHYPAYLSLEQEVLPADGDTLVVPEGTRLAIAGRATTPLSAVALRSGSTAIDLDVRDMSFSGEMVPRGDATWELRPEAVQGGIIDGLPLPLVIRVVPDSAPLVSVPVPGADTVAPPSRRLPLVVAIEDDHGIRTAVIEARRGRSGPLQRIVLGLGPGVADRALVSHTVDLDSLGMMPGDTLRYVAVASDNAPNPRTGRSREYLLRMPTEAEQREARQEATSTAADGLDSLSAAARQAQRAAEDLARERQRGARSGDPATPEPLSSEAARRAEQAAEAQRDVTEKLEELQQQVAELERAAERQGSADTALANQLSEIRELLEKAMSPELRQAMEKLQESLRELDADRTREALRDLAQEQAKMREAIDRARELFERAALETELANLAQEAQELTAQQEAATEQLAADSAAGARTEEQLADRADSLAAALEASADKMPSEQTQAGLQEAAQQAREAAQQMRNASQSARQGRRQQAQQQAQAAGEALKPIEKQVQDEREEMQEAMKQEVIAALDRLLAETSRLLGRQYAVAESFRRGALAGPLRTEESMLEEGTGKLLEQVIAVAGKNALISPRISVALAAARDGMRGAIEATAAASPSLGLASDHAGEAVDALSLAAYSLLRSKQNVENAESGSGLEEAMQQMQQAAGQQGELSDQGQSMMQQGQPDMQAMMQMAMQQRAIAQQLERMRARGQMPGASELAQEARELSRTLEQGRLNPETVERQQRLFRRMLDAGRSLEGDERDEEKERQSEDARAGALARPGAVDPRLLRGPEFPLPSWEELQRLSPDDRRRVLDYFRRLAEAPRQ